MLLAVVVGGAAGISVQDSEKQTKKQAVLFQIPKSPVPAHTTFSLPNHVYQQGVFPNYVLQQGALQEPQKAAHQNQTLWGTGPPKRVWERVFKPKIVAGG